MTETSEISIFKTSVYHQNEISKLARLLNTIIGKNNWNFDLEDRDKILRIKACPSANNFLTQEINKLGFECQELL